MDRGRRSRRRARRDGARAVCRLHRSVMDPARPCPGAALDDARGRGLGERVWLSIPGWTPRVAPMLRPAVTPRVLPVPGTIPVDRDRPGIAALRRRLLGGAKALGVFRWADDTSKPHSTAPSVRSRQKGRHQVRADGPWNGELARRLRGRRGQCDRSPAARELTASSGVRSAAPAYVDGISGRRTTTISALEHAVPVVTTFGPLGTVLARDRRRDDRRRDAELLAEAVERLLEPRRNAEARSAA